MTDGFTPTKARESKKTSGRVLVTLFTGHAQLLATDGVYRRPRRSRRKRLLVRKVNCDARRLRRAFTQWQPNVKQGATLPQGQVEACQPLGEPRMNLIKRSTSALPGRRCKLKKNRRLKNLGGKPAKEQDLTLSLVGKAAAIVSDVQAVQKAANKRREHLTQCLTS